MYVTVLIDIFVTLQVVCCRSLSLDINVTMVEVFITTKIPKRQSVNALAIGSAVIAHVRSILLSLHSFFVKVVL